MADERDPKLSQHYRSLEPLEPPREIDQAILAAARRAADKPHAPLVAPAGRHRWYYSLAAAAVLIFAVALTLHIERERPDQEAAEPAPARAPELRLERELRGQIKPAPEAEPKPAAKPETGPPAVREREPAPTFTPEPPASPPPQQPRAAAEASRDAVGAQPSVPAPLLKAAPSPAPAAARAPRSDELRARGEASQAEQAAAKQAQARAQQYAAPAAAAPAAAPVPPENPERWLERIAELRSRGKHEEADKQLAEFRRVYPNYRLSEVMRERVEGK